jgi:hypothetical protein
MGRHVAPRLPQPSTVPVPAEWLTVVGTLLGAGTLYFTAVAWRDARRAKRARAKLDVTLRVLDGVDVDGVRKTRTSTKVVHVEVGISNTGNREAGRTVVNVLAPASLPRLRWSGRRGEQRKDLDPPAPIPSESLTDADGREHPAQYLYRELSGVRLRPGTVCHFSFTMKAGWDSVPLLVKVQADELPEDVPEVTAHLMVRAVYSG